MWFTGRASPFVFKSSNIKAAKTCCECVWVCVFQCLCMCWGNGGWEGGCCSCCLQNRNSLLVMLQSRLHLSQLKSVFPHKQQSMAHKNSFCFSINNPLVLSPLHMCMCVYMYLSAWHKQSPILPSGTQSDPSVSPQKTNFTGDVQFFSDTPPHVAERDKKKEGLGGGALTYTE